MKTIADQLRESAHALSGLLNAAADQVDRLRRSNIELASQVQNLTTLAKFGDGRTVQQVQEEAVADYLARQKAKADKPKWVLRPGANDSDIGLKDLVEAVIEAKVIAQQRGADVDEIHITGAQFDRLKADATAAFFPMFHCEDSDSMILGVKIVIVD